MAVLPQGTALADGVTFVQQPSRTWNINRDTLRVQGEAEGLPAVSQAVDIILHTERFRWQIFRPYSGMQWAGLIGQDPGYVAAELQRRVTEALSVDSRVRGISDFAYTIQGDTLSATLTVETVYGSVQTSVEVNLS